MPRPVAPRFELTVLKDKSTSDRAQVPGASTINFYRQGATVRDQVTLQPFEESAPVGVFDAGELLVNDSVRLGSTSTILVVSDVVSSTELLLTSNSPTAVTLGAGSRLVLTSRRPEVFKDPLCTESFGSSIESDATLGRAAAYFSRNRLDAEVVVAAEDKRLYVDVAGSYGRSDGRWFDLRDFRGDLQAAVDALPPNGGTIFVPTGTNLLNAGLTVTKPNVTILGEQNGSVLAPPEALRNAFDLITVERANFRLRDITMTGITQTSLSNPKSCVVVNGPSISGHDVSGLTLINVVLEAAPQYGLWLRDVGYCFASNSQFLFNQASGVRIDGVIDSVCEVRLVACGASQNSLHGLEAHDASALLLQDSVFEGNHGGSGLDEWHGLGIDVENCPRMDLRSCYFEDPRSPTRAHQFVALRSCPSAVAEGCWFQAGDGPAFESSRPNFAVLFKTSPGSRLANCGMQRCYEAIARFTADSPDSVEFGNRDLEPGVTTDRLKIETNRFIGMSRRALGIPIHLEGEGTLPSASAVTVGSLAWLKDPSTGAGRLMALFIEGWKEIALG